MRKTIIGTAILFSAGVVISQSDIQLLASEITEQPVTEQPVIENQTETDDSQLNQTAAVSDFEAPTTDPSASGEETLEESVKEMDSSDVMDSSDLKEDPPGKEEDSSISESGKDAEDDAVVSENPSDAPDENAGDSDAKTETADPGQSDKFDVVIPSEDGTESETVVATLTLSDPVTNGWSSDKLSYYVDGQKVTGQKYIDGYWYCFNENGTKITGLHTISDSLNDSTSLTVFYDSEGRMVFGEYEISTDDWRYFNLTNGNMLTGAFKQIAHSVSNNNLDAMYYYLDSGKKAKGQRYINGNWYCFDLNTGNMKTGFTYLSAEYQPSGTKTVYYGSDGKMVYGQQKIGKNWYCFDLSTGKMFTGLTNLSKAYQPDGSKTVLYANSGEMLYGSQTWNGKKMFFNTTTGERIASKFVKFSGNLYYYDDNGYQVSGQKYINGKWRFFDPDKNNAMAVSRFVYLDSVQEKSGAKTVYYDANGYMLFGQQQINGKWYCFDLSTGKMFTGLKNLSKAYQPDGAKTVYYNSSGEMEYGIKTINGKRMYFQTATGALQKNKIVTDNNKSYYADANGYLTAGQKFYNGKWYFFDPSNDGVMVKSQFVYLDAAQEKNGAKTVYYNKNGEMLFGQQKINGNWYCFDLNTGSMFTGFTNLSTKYEPSGAKTVYYDTETGKMLYGQQQIKNKLYFFDTTTGALKKNFITSITIDGVTGKVCYGNQGAQVYGQQKVDGKWYFFDASNHGFMVTGLYTISAKDNNGISKTVFYNNDGSMFFGQKVINGKWNFFDTVTGARVFNNFAYITAAYNNGTAKTCYYGTDGGMLFGTFTLGKVNFTANDSTGNIEKVVVNGIPYYNQYDLQWKNTQVGISTIGSTGCVPTVITMVVNYFLNTSYTPLDVARILNAAGYYNVTEEGTGGDGVVFSASHFGLSIVRSLTKATILSSLQQGGLITAAMNYGTFCEFPGYTHEILVYGYNNGYVNVYDPYRSERNGVYHIDTILSQLSTAAGDNLAGGPIFAWFR